MRYICIENREIIACLDYIPTVPATVSVVEITDEEYNLMQRRTHYFDIEMGQVISRSEDILTQQQIEKDNIEYKNFLISTDWKVLRHLRQLALGVEPSLTNDEYLELERQRQDAANQIK